MISPRREVVSVTRGPGTARLVLDCGHVVKLKSRSRRGKDGKMHAAKYLWTRCDWCAE